LAEGKAVAEGSVETTAMKKGLSNRYGMGSFTAKTNLIAGATEFVQALSSAGAPFYFDQLISSDPGRFVGASKHLVLTDSRQNIFIHPH